MYSFRPAISQLCIKRSPGELQPGLIDVGAQPVGSSHPDHYRGRVGNQSEAPFALTDYLRSLFMLFGEGCENRKR